MNGKLEHVGEAATRDILLDDVGRDLGTKLDWVAVDHWNTDSGIPAGRSNRSAAMRLGSDPYLRDQLIRFRFCEFAIPTSVLKLDEPAPLVFVVVSHGS